MAMRIETAMVKCTRYKTMAGRMKNSDDERKNTNQTYLCTYIVDKLVIIWDNRLNKTDI